MKQALIIALLTLLIPAKEQFFYIYKGKRPLNKFIKNMHFNNIADFKNIPQNLYFYSQQIIPFKDEEIKNYKKEFINRWFEPWNQDSINEPYEDLTWQFRYVKRRKIYNIYKERVPEALIKYWIKNSNFDQLDTLKLKAITIKHSNLRAFPTSYAIFRDPKRYSGRYPFDMAQHSSIEINTPLYISHYSLDKKWAFVHAPYAFGWIKREDIALVDSNIISTFYSNPLYVLIRDNSILKKDKKFITYIKMGALFPYDKIKKYPIVIFKENSKAKIGYIKNYQKFIKRWPLKFNPINVAYIASQLKDEPYGWGGVGYCRDCSATTKDFFAIFGIFLKRNSSDQSKEGVRWINLKGLSIKERKRRILEYAKPFRSLLYVPGHIGIYIGRYKNEPIILHTYWGIRLKNWDKYPLSRTIITTLQPGIERDDLRVKSTMSRTLQKIINF